MFLNNIITQVEPIRGIAQIYTCICQKKMFREVYFTTKLSCKTCITTEFSPSK